MFTGAAKAVLFSGVDKEVLLLAGVARDDLLAGPASEVLFSLGATKAVLLTRAVRDV